MRKRAHLCPPLRPPFQLDDHVSLKLIFNRARKAKKHVANLRNRWKIPFNDPQDTSYMWCVGAHDWVDGDKTPRVVPEDVAQVM